MVSSVWCDSLVYSGNIVVWCHKFCRWVPTLLCDAVQFGRLVITLWYHWRSISGAHMMSLSKNQYQVVTLWCHSVKISIRYWHLEGFTFLKTAFLSLITLLHIDEWSDVKLAIFNLLKSCSKTLLESLFMYTGKKEIYCIFKICCIICVLFSTKWHLFHNLTFFYSRMFFINNVVEFKFFTHASSLLSLQNFGPQKCIQHIDWMQMVWIRGLEL